jgi:hypothetical protein
MRRIFSIFIICVEFLFFEKSDFTFSTYRHVIAHNHVYDFFSEAAIEAGFFSTSEPDAGT